MVRPWYIIPRPHHVNHVHVAPFWAERGRPSTFCKSETLAATETLPRVQSADKVSQRPEYFFMYCEPIFAQCSTSARGRIRRSSAMLRSAAVCAT